EVGRDRCPANTPAPRSGHLGAVAGGTYPDQGAGCPYRLRANLRFGGAIWTVLRFARHDVSGMAPERGAAFEGACLRPAYQRRAEGFSSDRVGGTSRRE